MLKLKTILIATTAIVPTLEISASNKADAPVDTLRLPEVEVVAPRKTDVTLTPLTVTTIDESTIEKSAQSSLLPVLQNQVPGLFVSERGFAGYGVSGGAAGAVSIRGVGEGNKVLFMIDGQPQWAGIFGHSLPDTYVANGVDHVEVVRGPSSLLYGSNAMGGSINIVTKRATEEGLSGRSRAMFGSFTTQKFNTAVSYRKGRFGATAAGQVDRSNGYRSGSEFWLANEYLQLQYKVNEHWQTGSNVNMTQTKANNPGTIQSPLLSMWTKLFRGTASVFAHNNYRNAQGGVQGYINWGSNHVDDGHAPDKAPKDFIFRSTDYNMGFTAFQNFTPWTGNKLSAGVDFVHWGGHSWNVMKETAEEKSDFTAHENEVAGYVMMQQGFWGDILALNAGVRLQHSSQYGNEWVPQAGFILRPAKGSSLKFSFGKGFRAPNLRELYLYMPANPDLKPEYLYNYEVELRQVALDGRLNAGLNLYFIDGKDMIQTRPVDGRPKNLNVGSFINKGFELDLSYLILKDLLFMTNYSYLYTTGDVLYAPKNKLYAQINYTPKQWSFTLESSSIWSLKTGGPEKSNYSLLNIRGAYTIQGHAPVTLMVKADNLTNKHYEIVYGCPMPGTTIMGGVEIKF